MPTTKAKTCARCDIAKPLDDFKVSKKHPLGRYSYCRACETDYFKERYAALTPAERATRATHIRANQIRRLYGLSVEMIAALYEEQEGCCAICGVHKPPPFPPLSKKKDILHIDHCHETGAVRGLLCFKCNNGLGSFNDSVAGLVKAAAYLTDRGAVS